MENINEENPEINSNPEPDSTPAQEETESKEAKQERIKKELLGRVLGGTIENIRDRVGYILNISNEARNSDLVLAFLFWDHFEREKYVGPAVTLEEMKGLTKMSSLCRIRAKIQNEYKLFQADDRVKKFRGKLEENRRDEAIEDKPSGLGIYTVYIDETGKTQKYLSVGSLWILKQNYVAATSAENELNKWKQSKDISFEFHFSEVTKNRLQLFKDFFVKFLTHFPLTGFKVIVVNNIGFADVPKAITDLTFHLIHQGVLDENKTGRAPLPRDLQVWIDDEQKGSDQLKIENIKERLTAVNVKGLYLIDMEAVSSKNNYHIQAIDLFTGAVNRKLNNPNGDNHKDELADFILAVLKFNINDVDTQTTDVDKAKMFKLADFDPSNL